MRGPAKERRERRPELVRGLLGKRGPERSLLPRHDGAKPDESKNEQHQNHPELDIRNPSELSHQGRLAIVDQPEHVRSAEPLDLDGPVPPIELCGGLLDPFTAGGMIPVTAARWRTESGTAS